MARAEESLSSTAASTRPRSSSSARCCATSTATTTTPRRSSSSAQALGGGQPAALPGDPAQPVRDGGRGARASRAAPGARVVVEKPFGRDSPRRGAQPRRCTQSSPRRAIFRIDHYPRQGAGAEPALLPLRQHVPRADLEPQLRRQRADHHGRELRRAGRGQLLRGGGRHPRRGAEPPAAGDGLLAMEPPSGRRHRGAPRREGAGCSRRCGRSTRPTWCAGSSAAIASEDGRGPRFRRSRPSPPCASTSTTGAGPACPSTSAPASACR